MKYILILLLAFGLAATAHAANYSNEGREAEQEAYYDCIDDGGTEAECDQGLPPELYGFFLLLYGLWVVRGEGAERLAGWRFKAIRRSSYADDESDDEQDSRAVVSSVRYALVAGVVVGWFLDNFLYTAYYFLRGLI